MPKALGTMLVTITKDCEVLQDKTGGVLLDSNFIRRHMTRTGVVRETPKDKLMSP